MGDKQRISDARKKGRADMAAFLLGITKDRPDALAEPTSEPMPACRTALLVRLISGLRLRIRAAVNAATTIVRRPK